MASSLQVLFLLSLTSGLFIAGAMSRTNELKEEEEEIVQACPPGWTQFRKRCFAYFSFWMTWADARKECENRGGNLASVRSYDEHVFISELMHQVMNYGVIWLGATDSTQDKSWYWIDGTPLLYTNWDNGEPNGGNLDNCLVMYYGGAPWTDARCHYRHHFICSKDAQKTCE